MKRQNKKSQRSLRARLFGTPKRFFVSGIAAVLVLVVGYFSVNEIWIAVYNYRTAQDLVASQQIRELIVRSVDSLRNAPVDARTGDVYFPEARLSIPRPADPVTLAYAAYPSIQADEISVINRSVVEQPIDQIVSARNVDEVFARVPKMQACARGVVLTYKQQSETLPDGELQKVIALSNGKKLYAFIDKGCEANVSTVKILSNIHPY